MCFMQKGNLRGMEMTRRSFLKIMFGFLVTLAAAKSGIFKIFSPKGIMFAGKARHYPGNIKDKIRSDIERTGKWLG